jgi:hypothetical protein
MRTDGVIRGRGATAGMARWTADEDAVLRRSYIDGGIEAARAALPHRTQSSIYRRAERIGATRRKRWTSADDASLRNLWGTETDLSEIAERLGRTLLTIYWRAQKLGLTLGCPEGWEYMTHAARRTGYTTSQLRRILEAAGAEISEAMTRRSPRRGRRPMHRHHIVMPEVVDSAVSRWLETEPLETAARRRGLCSETLARRLRDAGIDKPKNMGRRWWRVTDDEVERALAHHRDLRKDAARHRRRGVRGRFCA